MSDNTTAIENAIEKQDTVNVPGRIEQSPQQQQSQATWYTPLVDIAENADGFVFQADLPGVKADDLDVTYEAGVLTISGKVHPRQPQGHRYVWREYGVGHFYRQFTIDAPVNAEGIRAEFKNGVLDLYVPKAELAKTRKIEIKST